MKKLEYFKPVEMKATKDIKGGTVELPPVLGDPK